LIQRLLGLDADLSARLRVAERPGLTRSLAVFFAHSGDSWFWLLGLVLLWWLGPSEWKHKALVMGVGILISAVLVMLIKFTIRRQRPAGQWGGIYRNTDPHSFPSGHAARAFLLAVLAVGLGPAWFGVLLAAWAPLVCLARVAMGVHYLSDVAAGMIFGAALGGLVLKLF
jgi:undecaprenyl-diphosphatase